MNGSKRDFGWTEIAEWSCFDEIPGVGSLFGIVFGIGIFARMIAEEMQIGRIEIALAALNKFEPAIELGKGTPTALIPATLAFPLDMKNTMG